MEIGVENSESISLWLKYCKYAMIYGMDINKEYNNDRVQIIKGDQSNETDINKVISIVGGDIDMILDDGSHIPEHQLLCFEKLFPYIKDGGIYIIEDIETSYWKKNNIYGYQTRYGALNII